LLGAPDLAVGALDRVHARLAWHGAFPVGLDGITGRRATVATDRLTDTAVTLCRPGADDPVADSAYAFPAVIADFELTGNLSIAAFGRVAFRGRVLASAGIILDGAALASIVRRYRDGK
jgi:hypothetical protein